MNRKQMVKDIYKIAGVLESLTCFPDRPLNSGIVAELADAVDKLELIGAQLLAEDVKPVERAEEDDWPKEDWSFSY